MRYCAQCALAIVTSGLCALCTVHCASALCELCALCPTCNCARLWSRWWDRHNCHGRLLSNYGEEPTRRLTLLVTCTQFLKCTCNMSPMTLPLFKSSLSAMHYSLIKELQWVTTQFLKCTSVTGVTAHMQNCGLTNISSL